MIKNAKQRDKSKNTRLLNIPYIVFLEQQKLGRGEKNSGLLRHAENFRNSPVTNDHHEDTFSDVSPVIH